MKIHGVEASALEAGGTQEVWTIPEPQTWCEFIFAKKTFFTISYYNFI